MQGIDLTRTLFIQPTWSVNPQRLKDDPPFMFKSSSDTGASEDELEIEDAINSRELAQARRYDYFRDIVHISTVTPVPGGARAQMCHYIVAPQVATEEGILHKTGTLRKDAKSESFVKFCKDEAELLAAFWEKLSPEHGLEWVAGWNVLFGAWPLLVGKAMQYRINVPDAFKADPLKTYQHIPVLSVDTIYTQGVYFKARPLPQLADIIEWWGMPTEDTLPPMTRKQVATMSDDDWMTFGCRAVEKQLHGMMDIVEFYYGAGQWQAAPPVVDLSSRGPKPTCAPDA